MMEDKEKIDVLRGIYEEMDDSGKERAISVVEKYLNKSDQKGVFMSDVRTVKIVKTMSEEEINMWSILITVLKNQGQDYGSVDNIASY